MCKYHKRISLSLPLSISVCRLIVCACQVKRLISFSVDSNRIRNFFAFQSNNNKFVPIDLSNSTTHFALLFSFSVLVIRFVFWWRQTFDSLLACCFYETNNSATNLCAHCFLQMKRFGGLRWCLLFVLIFIRFAFGVSPENLWWLSTRNLNSAPIFRCYCCYCLYALRNSCSFFSHFVRIRIDTIRYWLANESLPKWKLFARKCEIIGATVRLALPSPILVFQPFSKSVLNVFEGFPH